MFRNAEVIIIPKPDKHNLSNLSSWHLISLLSCLSKGLERIITKRMAYLAIKYDILYEN